MPSRDTGDSFRVGTLHEQLEAERARLFVGREAELAALEGLLEPGSAALVGYVHGPGGGGKTELLRELARRCRARGNPCGAIDCALIPAQATAFRAAFGAALEQSGRPADRATVVLVDGAELLEPIRAWLWRSFLPELTVGTVVVVAGRQRPPAELLADPGWRRVARILPLGPLSREESEIYLERRGVPSDQRGPAYRSTRGHPLALALLAEIVEQTSEPVPDLRARPDLVEHLLAQLVDQVPSPLHRQALWSAALVARLTADLLRAMVVSQHAAALFEWLRGLSFMEAATAGLRPHELVRELLQTDLRWREPTLEQALVQRATVHLLERLDTPMTDGAAALAELAYVVGGRTPIMARGGPAPFAVDPARPAEWEAMEALARRHEGPESARLLAHWLTHGGEAWAIRGAEEQIVGFVLLLELARLNVEDAKDPGVEPLYHWLSGRGPDGTDALYMRQWMVADSYQDTTPAQSAAAVFAMLQVLQRRPRFFAVCEHDPEAHLAGVPPGTFERLAACDFELDGRRYGLLGRDFATETPARWFKRNVSAMLGASAELAATPGALDRRAFGRAIRSALQTIDRPDLLLGNPLSGASWVRGAAAPGDPQARVAALQQIIRQQCAMFLDSAKDAVLHRVLSTTYLEPRTKQLAAADALGMPYGTYRRHLGNARRRLTDALWQRELADRSAGEPDKA